jgi:hypothetical protein
MTTPTYRYSGWVGSNFATAGEWSVPVRDRRTLANLWAIAADTFDRYVGDLRIRVEPCEPTP